MSGGVLGGEAVGELHQHLGRPEFGAVQASGERVDGLGLGDDLFGLLIGEAARVGEASEILLIGVEIFDGVFGADENHDGLAAFFGFADVDDFDSRGFFGEGAVVAQDVGVVGEFFGFADVVAEDVFRRGNCGGLGEVIDERAHELGPGRPLFDFGGIVRVHILRFGSRDEDEEGKRSRGQALLRHEQGLLGDTHLGCDVA